VERFGFALSVAGGLPLFKEPVQAAVNGLVVVAALLFQLQHPYEGLKPGAVP
jgi:hypothetical protein